MYEDLTFLKIDSTKTHRMGVKHTIDCCCILGCAFSEWHKDLSVE